MCPIWHEWTGVSPPLYMGVRMTDFQLSCQGLTIFQFHLCFLQAPSIPANMNRMLHISRQDNYIGCSLGNLTRWGLVILKQEAFSARVYQTTQWNLESKWPMRKPRNTTPPPGEWSTLMWKSILVSLSSPWGLPFRCPTATATVIPGLSRPGLLSQRLA